MTSIWNDRHDIDDNGCWIIRGFRDPWGYSQKVFDGKNMILGEGITTDFGQGSLRESIYRS